MKNSREVPQKIKDRVTMLPNNPSPGYLPEKFENIYLERYMHCYVHCSIIHGGHDMETTKGSFNRRLDEDDVLHIHNGILRSHKERNTAICDNVDGP